MECQKTFRIISELKHRKNGCSIFPSLCSTNQTEVIEVLRIAWCYDDLSIGCSIIIGAKSKGNRQNLKFGGRAYTNTIEPTNG